MEARRGVSDPRKGQERDMEAEQNAGTRGR